MDGWTEGLFEKGMKKGTKETMTEGNTGKKGKKETGLVTDGWTEGIFEEGMKKGTKETMTEGKEGRAILERNKERYQENDEGRKGRRKGRKEIGLVVLEGRKKRRKTGR